MTGRHVYTVEIEARDPDHFDGICNAVEAAGGEVTIFKHEVLDDGRRVVVTPDTPEE